MISSYKLKMLLNTYMHVKLYMYTLASISMSLCSYACFMIHKAYYFCCNKLKTSSQYLLPYGGLYSNQKFINKCLNINFDGFTVCQRQCIITVMQLMPFELSLFKTVQAERNSVLS